ncbi:helix-turn-helix domain-containing protein [Hymenobacter sp. NBH84]|uniref:helix-turn-helix domain-containing protein n=1 Tax=Hymenobacter sp. NBH84 TaxID=2596915 RepID=UPI001623CAD7|nr:helix-turn-helix domain-containing protein [Hymenobacter sp. NBH84]QNE40902.1 helix-turn-helix domain-containing protein [Hymenobacter sp. NBH84]
MQTETIITARLTPAELVELLRPMIRFELGQLLTSVPAAAEAEELLTVRAAATLLNVCPQTVHDWKRRGVLPYHKMGGRTYLKRADLLNALQAHQRSEKPARKETARPVMRKMA